MNAHLIACLSALFLAEHASAGGTCYQWESQYGVPGHFGSVHAFAVFDDGTGPALFLGGHLQSSVGGPVTNVVRKSGDSWIFLGAGSDHGVHDMVVFDDGSGPALYVGGSFETIAGLPAGHVARWDGQSWSTLGSGTNDVVHGLAVFDDGSGPSLYAAGFFSAAGGVPAQRIARWDGAGWHAVGGGLDGLAYSLATYDDGMGPALYAGGYLTGAGGAPVHRIASWDGASWSDVGGGMQSSLPYNGVFSLAVFDDGSGPALYAGGIFTRAGGTPASCVARWDGGTWSALGSGVDWIVNALRGFDDGSGPALYVGGQFATAGGVEANHVARWDGSAWSSPGGGVDAQVYAFGSIDEGSGPTLYAGGLYDSPLAPNEHLDRWRPCSLSYVEVCAGDGSLASCPCANDGSPGHGCENSAATGGGSLAPSGPTFPDALHLTARGLLPTTLAILLQGDASTGAAAVPFGDGLRCIGGRLLRLAVGTASGGAIAFPPPGEPAISERSAMLGDPLAPGEVRTYQAVYRDPDFAFCPQPAGGTWNATNGVSVAW